MIKDQLSELYTGLKNLESENSNADYGSGNMGVSSTRYPAEANEYHYQYRDTQLKISQLENLQELCDSQIQQILDKDDDYREQARTYYKEYVNLKPAV